jgi:hypothetical protein
MEVSDLMPGAVIETLGCHYYILATKRHPRFGLECQVKRGKQAGSLWYSAKIVEKWLDDAECIQTVQEETSHAKA